MAKGGRSHNNWLTRVLDDAALSTGVDNITLESAEQQATNMVHWSHT